jgi:hypothetical protein
MERMLIGYQRQIQMPHPHATFAPNRGDSRSIAASRAKIRSKGHGLTTRRSTHFAPISAFAPKPRRFAMCGSMRRIRPVRLDRAWESHSLLYWASNRGTRSERLISGKIFPTSRLRVRPAFTSARFHFPAVHPQNNSASRTRATTSFEIQSISSSIKLNQGEKIAN